MKRLIANHTSTEMHVEVNEQIMDDTLKSRYLKQQSTLEFSLAKKIVNHLPIAPTNNLIYKIYRDILNGVFNDVMSSDFNEILNFTINLLKRQGIMIDYLPDNTRKYEHINNALTKNAKFNLARIDNPEDYIDTKWYNPYENQEFTIKDLVNNDKDFMLDYINEDYVDYVGVADFEDWSDDNELQRVAKKVPINKFKDYISKNKCKFIGYIGE